MANGYELIKRIAECSHAMGIGANEPAVDLAGHTLSFLVAHPEHIDRYMKEGNELWLDRTITYEGGCLSYRAVDGQIRNPAELREYLRQQREGA